MAEEKRNGHLPKLIDWNKVDQLLEAGCKGTEIAAYFGVHEDTLYTRCQNEKGSRFSAYSQEKRSKGDSILRAKQFENAMKGNTTMQIWLGKQRLDQRDSKDDVQQAQKVVFEVNYKNDSSDPVKISSKNIPDSNTPSAE